MKPRIWRPFLAVSVLLLTALLGFVSAPRAAMQPIRSGADWRDTAGNLIEAHDGGIYQEGGTNYLYGTDRSQNNDWFYRINLYSSTNLVDWTLRNRVLTSISDPALVGSAIVERPKLVRCPSTGKYVLWFHLEDTANSSYTLCRVARADCDTVDGNYVYRGSFRPQGADSRDMGLFQDTDGKAYLLCSVLNNQTNAIYPLDSTYTTNSTPAVATVTGYVQGQSSLNGEGHSMLKVGNTYFWFKSGYTGWAPNDNYYSWATNIAGPWNNGGFFVPTGSQTYYSQNYYTMSVTGSLGTTYFYMGDRWNPSAHSQDRLVWLPLTISGTTASAIWYDTWNIDAVTGTWQPGTNYVTNGIYKIVSRNSGLVIAATGTTNNSPVAQVAYTGSSNQLWTVTYLGGTTGSYCISNGQSGRALEVSGAATGNGATIGSSDYSGASNQRWYVSPTDSGYACLLGVGSLRTVEVPGSSTSSGTVLDLYDRSGGNNQQWAFVPLNSGGTVTGPSLLYTTNGYSLRPSVWTSGSIGGAFAMGSNDVVITHLGYFDNGADGLVDSHPVGIFGRGSGTLLAGVTVPAGTGAFYTNGYRWVSLATPFTLKAGSNYVIASQSPTAMDPMPDYFIPPWNTNFVGATATTSRRALYSNGGAWPTEPNQGGTWGDNAIYGAPNLADFSGTLVISQQPQSVVRYLGDTASFSIVAAGATGYQWYKAPGTLLAGQNSSTLMLTNLTLADAGNYYCIVSNVAVSVTSSNAALTVFVQAYNQMLYGTNGYTALRSNFTPNIGATFRVGAANLSVTHLGYFDAGADGLQVAHDVGIYSKGNPAGTGTLLAGVLVPAGTGATYTNGYRWMALAAPLTLQSNTDYVIACSTNNVDLWPDSFVPAWNTNVFGNTATNTRYFMWDSVTNWPHEPANQANAAYGWNKTYGAFNLLFANTNLPIILNGPQSVTNYTGTSFTLTVTAGGAAPLAYQWWKQGVGGIAGATNYQYGVASARTNDNGSYYVVVTNGFGSATSAVATVTILPVNISIQKSGNSLILSWPSGALQQSTNVVGPYNDVIPSTSPYATPATNAATFFRIRLN